MSTKFRPQSLISSKNIEINELLNLIAYYLVPSRLHSIGIECISGFLNVPLWGVNLSIHDSLSNVLARSFPYVLDEKKRDEVANILARLPKLSLLSSEEDKLKITKTLFHETSRKGYAVFLYGARAFERDKEYRKSVFKKYMEKMAVALNSGEIVAANGDGVSSLSLRPVVAKVFYSDWAKWIISFDDSLKFFGGDVGFDFWSDFVIKNIDCELDLVLPDESVVAARILEFDEIESQGYVTGLIKEYLTKTFWNISQGGSVVNFPNECILEEKNAHGGLSGSEDAAINILALEDFVSFKKEVKHDNLIDSKFVSDKFSKSQSDFLYKKESSSESIDAALTNVGDNRLKNDRYIGKKDIAALMSIGVSTLATYINGGSGFHVPFPEYTTFARKKVWKSSEVYEWIEAFRVWKMQRK